jgi:hypothetical protein
MTGDGGDSAPILVDSHPRPILRAARVCSIDGLDSCSGVGAAFNVEGADIGIGIRDTVRSKEISAMKGDVRQVEK